MGKFIPMVRSEDGINLQVWDPVKPCVPDECPMSDRCKVLEQRKLLTGSTICLWEQRYLKATAWLLIDDELGIGDQLNDAEKSTFASQATMLAYQMVLFMKTVHGMTDQETFPTDRTGKKYEHPVFKSMRDTLAQYNKLMKEYNVYRLWANKFGDPKIPGPATNHGDFFERGDPSHHTRLMQGGAIAAEEEVKDEAPDTDTPDDGRHWKDRVRNQRTGVKYERKTIPKPGKVDGRGRPPKLSAEGTKPKPRKKRGPKPKGSGEKKLPGSETTPDF